MEKETGMSPETYAAWLKEKKLNVDNWSNRLSFVNYLNLKDIENATETQEFDNFDRTMRDLIEVPRSDIKTRSDAEKKAKKRKRSARHRGSEHP